MKKNDKLVGDLIKGDNRVLKLYRGGKIIYSPLQEYEEIVNNKARLVLNDSSIIEIPFIDENDHTLYGTEISAYSSTCVSAEVLSGVTTLDRTFNKFSAMTSVTITDDVTTCEGSNIFCDCHSLKRMNSDADGVFQLPQNMTAIPQGFAARCYEARSIIIPSGVTSMGSMILEGNSMQYIFAQGLTAPTITANTFSSPGNSGTCYHFYNTPTYSNWMGTGNYYLGKYGWNSKSVSEVPTHRVKVGGKWIECYGSYTQTGIDVDFNTARMYKQFIEEEEIYDGITTLGTGAVSGQTMMTSITIPDSVVSLGQTAFQADSSLTGVTLPTGLTSIGYGCFVNCSGLTEVDIPSSLTSIGDRSFDNTPAMTTLICRATTPPTFTRPSGTMVGLFNGNCGIQHIYVPAGSVSTYKAATGWSINASLISAIP